jgi:hypothetical protein
MPARKETTEERRHGLQGILKKEVRLHEHGHSFKEGPNVPTRRFCDGPRILDIAQQIPSDNPAWIALISDEVTQLEGIAVASWFSL